MMRKLSLCFFLLLLFAGCARESQVQDTLQPQDFRFDRSIEMKNRFLSQPYKIYSKGDRLSEAQVARLEKLVNSEAFNGWLVLTVQNAQTVLDEGGDFRNIETTGEQAPEKIETALSEPFEQFLMLSPPSESSDGEWVQYYESPQGASWLSVYLPKSERVVGLRMVD